MSIERLREGIKRFAMEVATEATGKLEPAIVTSVNKNIATVDVRLLDGDLEVQGLQLRASEDNDTGLVVFPKTGSVVMVELFTNTVQLTSELESIGIKIDNVLFEADTSGFLIARGNQNLKVILQDLCTAIAQITVSTPNGPSGTPINAATFNTISNRLSQLLKS